jgi:hypothetical protein
MWARRGVRWHSQLIYEGYTYVVFPGDPYQMVNDLERFLKQIAYTSERGIDWDATQVAERVGNRIIRGVVFEMDNWLYNRMVKFSYKHL